MRRVYHRPDLAHGYALDGDYDGHYMFLIQRRPATGRPLATLDLNIDGLCALQEFLLAHNLLYQVGLAPTLRLRGRFETPHSGQAFAARLRTVVCFGTQSRDMDVSQKIKGAARARIDQSKYDFRSFCHGLADTINQGAPDDAVDGAPRRLVTLLPLEYKHGFSALAAGDVPELCCDLPWPLVGPVPTDPPGGYWGWCPPPPEPKPGYPHLKQLFASYPLDELSRTLLHMYIFGCFHSVSLTESVPLLVVDSWEQAVGKSEVARAVGTLLDRDPPSIAPPYPGQDQADTLASNFAAGVHFVLYDNLDSLREWEGGWLATLLSNRSAMKRIRYRPADTVFRARYGAATMVFGRACLGKDLRSRAWRVQLLGTADQWEGTGGPEPKAHVYAKEHRAALVSECYWAVARSHDRAGAAGNDRAAKFESIAALAYEEVFGRPPDLTHKRAHCEMLSPRALQLFAKHKIPFPTEPLKSQPLPPNADCSSLVGGTALGYRVVEGHKLESIE